MNIRRTFLRIEELGERTLPSGFAYVPPASAAAALVQDPLPPIQVLQGHLHGQATSEFTVPDVGVAWQLHGSGNLAGMGHVQVSGDVHGTGNIANGTASGILTLHNAGGIVVLKLAEPGQGSFTLPQAFNYTVASATGGYQNFLNDHGSLHLVLTTDSVTHATTFTITVGPGFIIPPEPLIPPAIAHIAGQATTSPVQSGAGKDWQLQGSGTLAGMGQVNVAGDVHAVGFIQNGHAGGTLTLQGANGSATLSLQGPKQNAFAPLPEKLHYHLVSHTGNIGDLNQHGTLTLVLTPEPNAPTQATFTLTI